MKDELVNFYRKFAHQKGFDEELRRYLRGRDI